MTSRQPIKRRTATAPHRISTERKTWLQNVVDDASILSCAGRSQRGNTMMSAVKTRYSHRTPLRFCRPIAANSSSAAYSACIGPSVNLVNPGSLEAKGNASLQWSRYDDKDMKWVSEAETLAGDHPDCLELCVYNTSS